MTYTQAQLDQIKTENDARMASFANKDATTTDTTKSDTSGNQDRINAIMDKALDSMDIVSSSNTGWEQALNDAVSSAKGEKEAGASRIESQFGEKIANIKEQGQQRYTSALEAQRGFGTNTAALKALNDDTQKQIKEYERMEQDALMQNNTQFASQISNLKLQAYQFQQQAQQQTFSNMLGLGQFALSAQQEERLTASTNNSKAQILGSPEKGIYAVLTNNDGTTSLEQILAPQQVGGDEPDFKIFGNPDNGMFIADMTDLDENGLPVVKPYLESQKDVTDKERLALAGSFATGFKDKFGWGAGSWEVPEGADIPNKKKGDTISDKELRNFLVQKYGISITEAKDIVDSLE